jgi:hypothetical protein
MQNPLSEYRNNLFSTHDNLDESFSYLHSMMSTLSNADRVGVNTAVCCLINTLAKEIDDVYHPTKNMSIASLIDKHLDDVLAQRVEEIVNDRVTEAIEQYMSEEFNICDYDHEIDWEDRISSNLNKNVIADLVEEAIKDNITFEVTVS